MFEKIISWIYSTRTMAVTVILFAAAMAVATFVENDFGTTAAKAVIYNTKWFEILMLLLVINFIGNVFNYRLYRREKWPVFLFHIGFIIILIGSFTTRYFSYEGVMPIREGASSSTIYSNLSYITIRVDNGSIAKIFDSKVFFSNISKNKYTLNEVFGTKDMEKTPFSVSLVDYVPYAMEKLVPDENGKKYMHIVESSSGARNDIFLKPGEVKSVRNILFTYDNPIEGGMNFYQVDGKMVLQPPVHGNYMEMRTQELTPVMKDSIEPLQLRKLYTFDELRFVIPEIATGRIVKESAPKSEQARYPYDGLTFKIASGGKEKTVKVRGIQGSILPPEEVSVNGLNFNISYGSKEINTPFKVKLRDFELERYPGTNSASSYASEVTIIDDERNEKFDYRIYMNHVLDYRGFRFFQSSYDKDEKGTLLSVNHDYWGTLITYWGYFLMGLGMFFTLFWKGTRFADLNKRLKKIQDKKAVLMVIFLIITLGVNAQEDVKPDYSKFTVSKEHAAKFGKLLVQDHKGRIKPIDTYALETLRKVYKKDTYKGLTAEQVLLSAQLNPRFWGNEYLIAIVSPLALGKELSSQLKVEDNHTSMFNFFFEGRYFLEDKVGEAFRLKKSLRNATDNEIINLDERANVWLNALKGSLMRIYPKAGDPNNKWYTGFDDQAFTGADTMILKMNEMYMVALQNAIATNDYSEADQFLGMISEYQKKIGSDIVPTQDKIDLEIKYNHWNIFKKLLFYYMIIGFFFLVLAFIDLFRPKTKWVGIALKIFSFLTVLGMAAHVVGLGLRWYITGHAPWSNGYEAIVFVSFITILAGLIFSHKRSKFVLASTVLFSSFLMGIAHGNLMNPEMTNLVPVLKSYWLMVHVAVITSSYGFLGLSALLGFIVMLLFILRNEGNAKLFNLTIKELTFINESAMTVGLFALSIGTFLGGVWASESWGRYWSWDAKEVWSLISMMVYIFILHMRLVPGLRGKFAFNFASLWSISTLIMTFFGVNFYLSGMHSYAAGDPVPIPIWVYYAITFFVIFSAVSYRQYSKFEKKR